MNRTARRLITATLFVIAFLGAASISVDPRVIKHLTFPDSAARADVGRDPFEVSWADDPLWDDGLAEVSIYDAVRVIDGSPRRYKAVLSVTKEDLDSRRLVTAPAGDRHRLPILKLNQFEQIPAPDGEHRLLTCVYVRRDDPLRFVKATAGHQQWCGNTFQSVVARGDHGRMTYSSCVDPEGDGSYEFDIRSGDVLTEQLPLALRGLRFEAGEGAPIRVLGPMTGDHVSHLEPASARLTVVGHEILTCGIGSVDAWRILLARESGAADTLWFEASPPHTLLRLAAADGRQLLLAARERRAGPLMLASMSS